MLETRQLACERGGARLFADLSFSLAAGELLRVRGPNGSGKTSLLRLLAGLTRPAAGAVRWKGSEIDEDFGREMLFLGHAAAVKDDLSVAENLGFCLGFSGIPSEKNSIEKGLETLGIATLADLPARFLSQGQRKRVALARLALAREVPLWLLDEPFSALDENGIGRVRALIETHLAAGGFVVLTSHQEIELAERSITLGARP